MSNTKTKPEIPLIPNTPEIKPDIPEKPNEIPYPGILPQRDPEPKPKPLEVPPSKE